MSHSRQISTLGGLRLVGLLSNLPRPAPTQERRLLPPVVALRGAVTGARAMWPGRSLGALLLAAAALVVPARPASAQLGVILPSVGLGVHGGVLAPNDGDTTGFGGAHVRFRLLPFLGLEAAASYGEATFPADVKIQLVPVQASALLYLLPVGPLQLYVAGGVGYYYLEVKPSGLASHSEDQVGYHAGAGLDIPLGGGLVLNVDARYYVLEDKVDGRSPQRLDLDGWQVRGGITYYFW